MKDWACGSHWNVFIAHNVEEARGHSNGCQGLVCLSELKTTFSVSLAAGMFELYNPAGGRRWERHVWLLIKCNIYHVCHADRHVGQLILEQREKKKVFYCDLHGNAVFTPSLPQLPLGYETKAVGWWLRQKENPNTRGSLEIRYYCYCKCCWKLGRVSTLTGVFETKRE